MMLCIFTQAKSIYIFHKGFFIEDSQQSEQNKPNPSKRNTTINNIKYVS